MEKEEKKYKVFLVEDIFFIDNPDTPEFITGLEKKIAGQTRHNLDLEITSDVKKALVNVKEKNYDLVVTDVGLDFPYANPYDKTKDYWKNQLPEVYQKMIESIKNSKKRLETVFGNSFDGDMIRVQELFNKLKEKGEMNPILIHDLYLIYQFYYWNESNNVMNEFGAEIYKSSKKSPTVIFTDLSHTDESIAKLHAHNIISPEGVVALNNLKKSFFKNYHEIKDKKPDKIDNIYVGSKSHDGTLNYSPNLENFAHVIDDAIDNFVNKKE